MKPREYRPPAANFLQLFFEAIVKKQKCALYKLCRRLLAFKLTPECALTAHYSTHHEHANMNNQESVRALNRIPVFTTDGARTSVSIPEKFIKDCIDAFGSRNEFAKQLHKAVRDADPRPGFSRSQLVRIALEEQMLRILLR